MKSVPIRSYSDPHFSGFGLNTERYLVSLRIQSECDKMPTRITLNTDTFYVVNAIIIKVNQNGKSGNSPNILRDFLKERIQRAVSSQRAIFFIEK